MGAFEVGEGLEPTQGNTITEYSYSLPTYTSHCEAIYSDQPFVPPSGIEPLPFGCKPNTTTITPWGRL